MFKKILPIILFAGIIALIVSDVLCVSRIVALENELKQLRHAKTLSVSRLEFDGLKSAMIKEAQAIRAAIGAQRSNQSIERRVGNNERTIEEHYVRIKEEFEKVYDLLRKHRDVLLKLRR